MYVCQALVLPRQVLTCIRRARRVQSCVPYCVVYTNVFHYGHNNGEEDSVYTMSSGDGGSRISCCQRLAMVAAGDGGRRQKSAYMDQRLFAAGASHPPTSTNPLGE